MAGLGRKVFTAGEVLTAADVNGYLMDQAVQVYAGTAARGSALGTSVSEGQVTYRTDDNALEVYDGSAWVEVGAGASSPNYIINGAFDVWQRGTSVANDATYTKYVTDRWQANRAALATGATISRRDVYDATNLPNIQYSARVQRDSGNTNTGEIYFLTTLDNATSAPLIGQQVTLSFYARAGANYSSASSVLSVRLDTGTGTDQSLGGALTGQTSIVSQNATLTTSWQRFTYTATVGTSARQVGFYCFYTPVGTAGANDWFEITGVQLEQGGAATTFRRAANTLQGELAACQRYYYRYAPGVQYSPIASGGIGQSTTNARMTVKHPVTMRSAPTSLDFGNLTLADTASLFTVTGLTQTYAGQDYSSVDAANAGTLTVFRAYFLVTNTTAGFIGFSAEL